MEEKRHRCEFFLCSHMKNDAVLFVGFFLPSRSIFSPLICLIMKSTWNFIVGVFLRKFSRERSVEWEIDS